MDAPQTLSATALLLGGMAWLVKDLLSERAAHKATRERLESELQSERTARVAEMKEHAKNSALYLAALKKQLGSSSPPPSSQR